jgi:hypothetical protein
VHIPRTRSSHIDIFFWDDLSVFASDIPLHSYRVCYFSKRPAKQTAAQFSNFEPYYCWFVEHRSSAFDPRSDVGDFGPRISTVRFVRLSYDDSG